MWYIAHPSIFDDRKDVKAVNVNAVDVELAEFSIRSCVGVAEIL